MVAIFSPVTAFAYTQITNVAANCTSLDDLREGMEQLVAETEANEHFDWGLAKTTFGSSNATATNPLNYSRTPF